MRPEIEKWYSQLPRNQKTVQSNDEKLKIKGVCCPEIEKRYKKHRSTARVYSIVTPALSGITWIQVCPRFSTIGSPFS